MCGFDWIGFAHQEEVLNPWPKQCDGALRVREKLYIKSMVTAQSTH